MLDVYALTYLKNKPKILHESITCRYHLYLLSYKIWKLQLQNWPSYGYLVDGSEKKKKQQDFFLHQDLIFHIQPKNILCEVRSINYIGNGLRPTSFLKINFREKCTEIFRNKLVQLEKFKLFEFPIFGKFVDNLLEAPWLQYVTRKTQILIGTKLYFNVFWTVDCMKFFAEL